MHAIAPTPLLASLLVMTGGALGALGRYQLGRAITHALGPMQIGQFPWATLAANVIGCGAMGLLFGWLARSGGGSEALRLLLGVGLLGGFTTFSAFSLEMLLLMERGSAGLALFYAGFSVAAGLGALWFGLVLMRGMA
ncbi:CrcB protein [Erythrobacter litoralis]|uniref:Fluoride-specific ion channel FluC n=1 Tax=Erythrobacter litoralis TaxID=39960 RepID=A0A074N5S9_9SPHN|nr:CrcB family protein [Erythrobacter litoralis]AOL24423.1 CrcB protein [Erythrobacter litoralis]KEO93337.1 camphor resistance protein CrcB [Erythrobacter litoralis]